MGLRCPEACVNGWKPPAILSSKAKQNTAAFSTGSTSIPNTPVFTLATGIVRSQLSTSPRPPANRTFSNQASKIQTKHQRLPSSRLVLLRATGHPRQERITVSRYRPVAAPKPNQAFNQPKVPRRASQGSPHCTRSAAVSSARAADL